MKAPVDPREVEALRFAVERHGAQSYGGLPYVVHLADVRKELSRWGVAPAHVHVAAWLHDVLEDTDTTREEIADRFGTDVAALVWAVSGMPKGAPRKARTADAYAKIVAHGYPAAMLKLCDRIANVRASAAHAILHPEDDGLLRMYRKEMAGFEPMLLAAGILPDSLALGDLHKLLTAR